ncbi:protein MAIN-LIKE 1-like [Arachis hypogaea]|uniref:protein MAIN-LIKE 1-like n=1 Tax=Arachis hypogaea TaxID=3818 RepID=UPI003B22131A
MCLSPNLPLLCDASTSDLPPPLLCDTVHLKSTGSSAMQCCPPLLHREELMMIMMTNDDDVMAAVVMVVVEEEEILEDGGIYRVVELLVNTQGHGDPATVQRVPPRRGEMTWPACSDWHHARAWWRWRGRVPMHHGGRAEAAGMQGTCLTPPNRNLLVRKLDLPQSWNPRVENYLRATGFYHVSRIGMIRGSHPLLAALVERWRPETHTFVLPVGDVTVTLEDVAHIFGLPIDGEPVSGWTDSSSDFVQSQSMAIFGRQPVLSRNSKSYIKLGWVRSVRDEEPLDTEKSIRRYVRCQIFCLLGSTLFTDKSTAYAHAKYLPLLRDFERIHTYSWGSACLAHLYRALCRASRYDTKEMDGPLNLLFVWAWERMPCISPVPRHILPPAEIPAAMRWSHSERSTAWLEKTVVTFRHDIDYMQEFEWRPYQGMIIPGELHRHLDVCDIVASLLSFECIEWHSADRVMRQFGFAQPPPRIRRDIPLEQHCMALRGVQLYYWTVLLGEWIAEWGNRRNTRMRDLHPLPTWDFIPTPEYRDWYVRSFGWWSVIGFDCGMICVRYSQAGFDTGLMVWNPLLRVAQRL